jgi:hypothetical protein
LIGYRIRSKTAVQKLPANKRWILAPLFGTLLFIGLYVIAVIFYPGGSEVDIHAIGFSQAHNYRCDLLNERGLNGEQNGGRGVAITAMIVPGLTLISLWVLYPKLMRFERKWRYIIQVPERSV